MSALARARDVKRARTEPFCTIRQDVLLFAAIRLSGRALRCYWLANAAWLPDKRDWGEGVTSGAAVLPIRRLQRPHAPNRPGRQCITPSTDTIRQGLDECVAAGLLVLLALGTRPGRAGGATAQASKYDVPHRHSANAPRVEMPPNVPRPDGKVRQINVRVRADIARINETEIRIFTYAVAHRDRTAEGHVKVQEPFSLSVRGLTDTLGIPSSTAGDALNGLLAKQLLIRDQMGTGRKASTYRLPTHWASPSSLRR